MYKNTTPHIVKERAKRIFVDDGDVLMTTQEASAYLRLSLSWFEKDRQKDKSLIPYHKIGRKIVYKKSALQNYIEKCKV